MSGYLVPGVAIFKGLVSVKVFIFLSYRPKLMLIIKSST